MSLPFTVEQFFEVFRRYNEAVWPFQAALLALGLAAVVLVFVRRAGAGAIVSAILAFLWAWMGIAYHFLRFAPVNPAAYAFGTVSILGAGIFVLEGVMRRRMRFAFAPGWRSAIGMALVAFALLGYPLWAWLAGHRYPGVPTFGLPCPTTLFTLGILGFLVPPHPWTPFLVPVLWCAVGSQAAILLGVPQDLALVPAGFAGVLLAWNGSRRRR